MKGPTARQVQNYAHHCLALGGFFRNPGDGRQHPQIPAEALVWALVIGAILRLTSFARVEWLVRSPGRAGMGVGCAFSDDALAYFTERLSAARLREALGMALHQAKRNKAFENSRFIGLALDGTGAGHTCKDPCPLCHPVKDSKGAVCGHVHKCVLLTVVGAGLTLPVDIEPYGPGDCEYNAGQRLLRRATARLGAGFADYVVVDGEFATAPFLHQAGETGRPVVARLKDNLPELRAAVERRFGGQPPQQVFQDGDDRIEIWDAEDFAPWETLHWERVRVLRYRQCKPHGQVIEAEWLTNFSPRQVQSRGLYRVAKSRWEIENQGFNDGKNRYGMEHIRHHEPNSLLVCWLLILLALVIERLYRIRYLHRGNHGIRSAIDLRDFLWLGLVGPFDSS